MEYRSLGRTGVMVSPLCLGAMNFGGPTDKAESFAIIDRALEAGINFIDTANVYNAGESERIVGEALKQDGRDARWSWRPRCTARWARAPTTRAASRYHILQACEDSLRRLQTDHIDLYQLHRPPLAIPQDETLRAFDDLVRSGKVLYIGCSTHPAWMVMEALAVSERHGLARYVSEQPPYNLLDRRIENELIPLCQKYGLAILPWSPLAGGILAGRYAAGGDSPKDSRAARWGDMFTPPPESRRASEVAERRRRDGPRARPDAGAAGPAVGQGPAGRHLAHHRPAHPGTPRGGAAGAGATAGRRRPPALRRPGPPRQRRRRLPQHQRLDEGADPVSRLQRLNRPRESVPVTAA